MYVSGSYFPVLELRPALGRLLSPSRRPGHRRESGRGAQLRYLGDEARVRSDRSSASRSSINGQPFTIIGVAPKGFDGTTLGGQPKIYVPISMRRRCSSRGFNALRPPHHYWIYAFARLKPGVSMAQAKRGIDAVYKPIINDVEAKLQKGMSDKTLETFPREGRSA